MLRMFLPLISRYEDTWETLHKRAKECAKAAEVGELLFIINKQTNPVICYAFFLTVDISWKNLTVFSFSY